MLSCQDDLEELYEADTLPNVGFVGLQFSDLETFTLAIQHEAKVFGDLSEVHANIKKLYTKIKNNGKIALMEENRRDTAWF